jgi:MFS family permease
MDRLEATSAPAINHGSLARVLWALIFVDTLSYALVLPQIPAWAERLGASTLAIGLLFATFSVCQMFAAPWLGALSAHTGRRRILLLCQSGSAAGFLLMPVPSLLTLWLSRVIDGATGAHVALVQATVLERFPREAWALRMASLWSATGSGILAGLLAGAVLAPLGLPVLATCSAVLQVAAMLLTMLGYPQGQARTEDATLRNFTWTGWRPVVSTPRGSNFRHVVGLQVLSGLIQGTFLLPLPLVLNMRFALDPAAVTRVLATLFVGAAVFQIVGLPRIQWLGVRRGAMLGFVCVTIGGLCLSVDSTLAITWLLGLAMLIGAAILGPSLAAWLGRANRWLDEGTLMGLQQTTGSFGQLAGPLLGYSALALFAVPGYALACAALGAAGVFTSLASREVS